MRKGALPPVQLSVEKRQGNKVLLPDPAHPHFSVQCRSLSSDGRRSTLAVLCLPPLAARSIAGMHGTAELQVPAEMFHAAASAARSPLITPARHVCIICRNPSTANTRRTVQAIVVQLAVSETVQAVNRRSSCV